MHFAVMHKNTPTLPPSKVVKIISLLAKTMAISKGIFIARLTSFSINGIQKIKNINL